MSTTATDFGQKHGSLFRGHRLVAMSLDVLLHVVPKSQIKNLTHYVRTAIVVGLSNQSFEMFELSRLDFVIFLIIPLK